jgi:tetratricopeptide (TPR) repeat protein
MPEGVIGGMLGDEDEQPELEEIESEACAEGFTAAVVHQASMEDPEVAREAAALLRGQLRYVELQIEEEHPLRLAHLKSQLHEERLRRFGMRLRISIQLIVVLFALGIFIGAALMVRDALNSRSVVIDPFDTPPSMVQGGINGKTVAAGLLDVLSKIQAATRGDAVRRSLSNAWTNEIAIEVPETGVSVAQIEHALQTRFGHDQHIVGELIQSPGGALTLTVRGNGIPPRSFTGIELDKLLKQAGEYVYGQSQPGLWTSYLANNGRPDEAIQFAQIAYASAPADDKPYILNNWGNAIVAKGAGADAMKEGLPLWREATRLKPDYWTGYNNIMAAMAGMGDEEGEVHEGELLIKAAGGRPGRAPEFLYENYDNAVRDLITLRAELMDDLDSHGGVGSNSAVTGSENLAIAQIDALMHDPDAAELRLKTTPLNPKAKPDLAFATFGNALIAQERGDSKAAVAAWDQYAALYTDPVVSTTGPQLICNAAVSYEKAGQGAKADKALNPAGGLNFVDCYRFRADVLDLRSNWPEAEQWYAKAIKLAPSLPTGYYSWGLALERHGYLDEAAMQFQVANQKSPHWADPLKAWGDVLIKQGKKEEALQKYNQALKFAPNWKELKEAIQSGTTR